MFQVFLRFGFSRDVVNNFKVPIVFNGTDTDATKQTLNQIRTNMISYLSDTSDSTLFDRDTSSSTSDLCRVLIDDAAHENEPETLLPYLVMIEPFYTKTKFFAAQIIENPLNPITKQIKQTEFQKLKDLGTNYPSTELSGHNSMKSVEDDHYIFFRLDEKSDTLKQLYDSYFAPTKKQKGEVSAVNDEFKMYKEMVELPELLIINMKRLKVNSKGQEYVDMRSIAVPENMTLSGYDEHQFQFKLHAFVTYQPIPAHYTSTVRDLTNPDVWHFFDDDFQDTKNLKEFWEPTTYNDVFNQEHGFFLDKASNQLNWEPKTNHGGDGRSIFFYLKDNEKRHSTL